MLACVDAHYRDDRAVGACVVFGDWSDAVGTEEHTAECSSAAPYESGKFFLRELPPILAVLTRVTPALRVVVVDGYAWLDSERPGLGAHLFEALNRRSTVVGVAKTAFAGAPAVRVLRGRSHRPLFITAAGIEPDVAAAWIRAMHGAGRIPTLLARSDRLARQAL